MRPARPPDLPELRSLVEKRLDDYLEDLRRCVDLDCGTYIPEGVNRVADLLQARFRAWGWTVERRPHAPAPGEPRLGDLLVARLAGSLGASADASEEDGVGRRRILLVGHMDTVFPDGTAALRPFRLEGGRAYGPGVSDMKAGLLGGLYAVRALQDAGAGTFGSVTFVCNPDEEIGSPFSTPVIREQAAGADVCFVLEGARESGEIVSARKGVRDVRIRFRGRAAHAGVEPDKGRSALLQAAHATVALHALNGRWTGVTVNVGVLRGGTRPNVVAEECELHVDVRAPDAVTFDEALREVERVAGEPVVPDVTVEVESRSWFAPMEKTPGTARLVEEAKAVAGELGFELDDTATGGASDANTVAAMGIPVLDGLGPVGGAAHAPGEWLDIESVVPRVTLLAALIARP